MGYYPPEISLLVSPCHFLLAQKVTNPDPVSLRDGSPMLPHTNPTRPSLGKEAIALFYWLVLRTPPYKLIINILTYRNPIIHVKIISSGMLKGAYAFSSANSIRSWIFRTTFTLSGAYISCDTA